VVDDLNRQSALADIAVATPAAPGQGIILRSQPPLIMLNLRGSADSALNAAVRGACGCELPIASNSSSNCNEGTILKLGPNEWLLVASNGTFWSEKMMIPGATLTDVSHARIAVEVDGEKSRDLLAKGCAIDLHPRQFAPGTCVQTSIAKIGVILHRPRNGDSFILYAARSYAGSCWHWLTAAAREYGYHVIAPQNNSAIQQL